MGVQTLKMNSKLEIAFPHNTKMDKNANVVTAPKLMPFPPCYPKSVPAAGGIFASLNGLIEILKIQMGHRPDILSQEVASQFSKPYIATKYIEKWKGKINFPVSVDRLESYYGLGWRRLRSKDHKGKDLIFHGGFIGGIRTFIGYMPSQESGIIILVNQNTKFPMQQGMNFWRAFLEKKSNKI